MVERDSRKLCDRLVEAIKDEGLASIDYGKIGDLLSESGITEVKHLRILLDKIVQDEMSHKIALQKVARLVCPIEHG